ncbi:MAG: type II secretion system protein GspD, partial [Alphaproteobacteria bacterium]
QSALFKFAKNEVFFRLDVERLIAADGKPDVENTTSQVQTIPIGLVMVVQPSVNLETQEITLTLRPSISKIVATKEDPAVTIKSNNAVTSNIPVVQIREMDSVLKIRSGEVIVMGGFMEEVVEDKAAGLPGLQDIPILGNIFQGREDQREVTELVIFLKASIVQDETVQPADYRLYNQFTQDPRPLF